MNMIMIKKQTTEMKAWQHGYDLDYLKWIESNYKHFNSFTGSPFAKYKKNNIAESLHKKNLFLLTDETTDFDGAIEITESKSTSNITMHGDTVIGVKKRGDITFSKIVGPNYEAIMKKINEYLNHNCWMYVWTEDPMMNEFAESCGFCKIGVKFTTFAEIYSIYFRSANNEEKQREFPKVIASELMSIKKLKIELNKTLIEKIADKFDNLQLKFSNHYSNYNKDDSWSALSLRGYTSDPAFITKPEEMNDKWNEQHKDTVFILQDTKLYDEFPEVRQLISFVKGAPHRIRLMRLKSGNGELERHTDQVDPDVGTKLGKLARLHFPIKTNENVIFTNWDCNGVPIKSNMKVGDCWYLDTRKPHMAINGGTEERIHLVIDFETDEELQKLICA